MVASRQRLLVAAFASSLGHSDQEHLRRCRQGGAALEIPAAGAVLARLPLAGGGAGVLRAEALVTVAASGETTRRLDLGEAATLARKPGGLAAVLGDGAEACPRCLALLGELIQGLDLEPPFRVWPG